MEHDLVAAAVGIAGDFGGMGMIGKDGEGQGIPQGEDGVDSGRIRGDIIENDGEARAGRDGVRRVRGSVGFGRTVRLQERLNRGFDPAAAGQGKRKHYHGKTEDDSGDSPGGREPKSHERN
jgi:hypothetical protein